MEQEFKDLTKDMIDEVFKNAKTQADYIVGLYKLVYPDWDSISKVLGYPAVSDATNTYIFKKAIDWDYWNARNVISGGAWMNHGFSGYKDNGVPDWMVRPCAVEYITEPVQK